MPNFHQILLGALQLPQLACFAGSLQRYIRSVGERLLISERGGRQPRLQSLAD